MKVLEAHIQFLAKIDQTTQCIDKEGNVALKLGMGKVWPHHRQNVFVCFDCGLTSR